MKTSSKDELSFQVHRLNTNSRYVFEVATQSQEGTSDARTVRITTPRFTGPHYTLSAPGSVQEGQTVTITVRRSNTNDGASTALVELRDSHNSHVRIISADFSSDATSATTTYDIPDDGQAISDRKITVRIGDVGRSTENTFSVERHTINARDTTN